MHQDAATPTVLLQAWRSGDEQALNTLLELVYDELARLARMALRHERRDHTLQTKALIHEAYLKLIDAKVDWQDRSHFFAVAARAMRRVLTDHARSRARSKRGGNPVRVELADVAAIAPAVSIDLIDLETALEKLARLDRRQCELVELHFYAGLDYNEVAEVLGVSPRTVGRDLRVARAFLARELGIQPT
jgi:RNA polymerase sigma-70 factor (ECF subfamily)